MPYPPGMKTDDIPGIDAGDELSYEQKRHLAMTEIEKRLADIYKLEDEIGCYINATICGCGQVDEITLEEK